MPNSQPVFVLSSARKLASDLSKASQLTAKVNTAIQPTLQLSNQVRSTTAARLNRTMSAYAQRMSALAEAYRQPAPPPPPPVKRIPPATPAQRQMPDRIVQIETDKDKLYQTVFKPTETPTPASTAEPKVEQEEKGVATVSPLGSRLFSMFPAAEASNITLPKSSEVGKTPPQPVIGEFNVQGDKLRLNLYPDKRVYYIPGEGLGSPSTFTTEVTPNANAYAVFYHPNYGLFVGIEDRTRGGKPNVEALAAQYKLSREEAQKLSQELQPLYAFKGVENVLGIGKVNPEEIIRMPYTYDDQLEEGKPLYFNEYTKEFTTVPTPNRVVIDPVTKQFSFTPTLAEGQEQVIYDASTRKALDSLFTYLNIQEEKEYQLEELARKPDVTSIFDVNPKAKPVDVDVSPFHPFQTVSRDATEVSTVFITSPTTGKVQPIELERDLVASNPFSWAFNLLIQSGDVPERYLSTLQVAPESKAPSFWNSLRAQIEASLFGNAVRRIRSIAYDVFASIDEWRASRLDTSTPQSFYLRAFTYSPNVTREVLDEMKETEKARLLGQARYNRLQAERLRQLNKLSSSVRLFAEYQQRLDSSKTTRDLFAAASDVSTLLSSQGIASADELVIHRRVFGAPSSQVYVFKDKKTEEQFKSLIDLFGGDRFAAASFVHRLAEDANLRLALQNYFKPIQDFYSFDVTAGIDRAPTELRPHLLTVGASELLFDRSEFINLIDAIKKHDPSKLRMSLSRAIYNETIEDETRLSDEDITQLLSFYHNPDFDKSIILYHFYDFVLQSGRAPSLNDLFVFYKDAQRDYFVRSASGVYVSPENYPQVTRDVAAKRLSTVLQDTKSWIHSTVEAAKLYRDMGDEQKAKDLLYEARNYLVHLYEFERQIRMANTYEGSDIFAAYAWSARPDSYYKFLDNLASAELQLGRPLSANEIRQIKESSYDIEHELIGQMVFDISNLLDIVGISALAGRGLRWAFRGLKSIPMVSNTLEAVSKTKLYRFFAAQSTRSKIYSASREITNFILRAFGADITNDEMDEVIRIAAETLESHRQAAAAAGVVVDYRKVAQEVMTQIYQTSNLGTRIRLSGFINERDFERLIRAIDGLVERDLQANLPVDRLASVIRRAREDTLQTLEEEFLRKADRLGVVDREIEHELQSVIKQYGGNITEDAARAVLAKRLGLGSPDDLYGFFYQRVKDKYFQQELRSLRAGRMFSFTAMESLRALGVEANVAWKGTNFLYDSFFGVLGRKLPAMRPFIDAAGRLYNIFISAWVYSVLARRPAWLIYNHLENVFRFITMPITSPNDFRRMIIGLVPDYARAKILEELGIPPADIGVGFIPMSGILDDQLYQKLTGQVGKIVSGFSVTEFSEGIPIFPLLNFYYTFFTHHYLANFRQLVMEGGVLNYATAPLRAVFGAVRTLNETIEYGMRLRVYHRLFTTLLSRIAPDAKKMLRARFMAQLPVQLDDLRQRLLARGMAADEVTRRLDDFERRFVRFVDLFINHWITNVTNPVRLTTLLSLSGDFNLLRLLSLTSKEFVDEMERRGVSSEIMDGIVKLVIDRLSKQVNIDEVTIRQVVDEVSRELDYTFDLLVISDHVRVNLEEALVQAGQAPNSPPPNVPSPNQPQPPQPSGAPAPRGRKPSRASRQARGAQQPAPSPQPAPSAPSPSQTVSSPPPPQPTFQPPSPIANPPRYPPPLSSVLPSPSKSRTRRPRKELRELGWTDAEISKMSVEEAIHKAENRIAPPTPPPPLEPTQSILDSPLETSSVPEVVVTSTGSNPVSVAQDSSARKAVFSTVDRANAENTAKTVRAKRAKALEEVGDVPPKEPKKAYKGKAKAAEPTEEELKVAKVMSEEAAASAEERAVAEAVPVEVTSVPEEVQPVTEVAPPEAKPVEPTPPAKKTTKAKEVRLTSGESFEPQKAKDVIIERFVLNNAYPFEPPSITITKELLDKSGKTYTDYVSYIRGVAEVAVKAKYDLNALTPREFMLLLFDVVRTANSPFIFPSHRAMIAVSIDAGVRLLREFGLDLSNETAYTVAKYMAEFAGVDWNVFEGQLKDYIDTVYVQAVKNRDAFKTYPNLKVGHELKLLTSPSGEETVKVLEKRVEEKVINESIYNSKRDVSAIIATLEEAINQVRNLPDDAPFKERTNAFLSQVNLFIQTVRDTKRRIDELKSLVTDEKILAELRQLNEQIIAYKAASQAIIDEIAVIIEESKKLFEPEIEERVVDEIVEDVKKVDNVVITEKRGKREVKIEPPISEPAEPVEVTHTVSVTPPKTTAKVEKKTETVTLSFSDLLRQTDKLSTKRVPPNTMLESLLKDRPFISEDRAKAYATDLLERSKQGLDAFDQPQDVLSLFGLELVRALYYGSDADFINAIDATFRALDVMGIQLYGNETVPEIVVDVVALSRLLPGEYWEAFATKVVDRYRAAAKKVKSEFFDEIGAPVSVAKEQRQALIDEFLSFTHNYTESRLRPLADKPVRVKIVMERRESYLKELAQDVNRQVGGVTTRQSQVRFTLKQEVTSEDGEVKKIIFRSSGKAGEEGKKEPGKTIKFSSKDVSDAKPPVHAAQEEAKMRTEAKKAERDVKTGHDVSPPEEVRITQNKREAKLGSVPEIDVEGIEKMPPDERVNFIRNLLAKIGSKRNYPNEVYERMHRVLSEVKFRDLATLVDPKTGREFIKPLEREVTIFDILGDEARYPEIARYFGVDHDSKEFQNILKALRDIDSQVRRLDTSLLTEVGDNPELSRLIKMLKVEFERYVLSEYSEEVAVHPKLFEFLANLRVASRNIIPTPEELLGRRIEYMTPDEIVFEYRDELARYLDEEILPIIEYYIERYPYAVPMISRSIESFLDNFSDESVREVVDFWVSSLPRTVDEWSEYFVENFGKKITVTTRSAYVIPSYISLRDAVVEYLSEYFPTQYYYDDLDALFDEVSGKFSYQIEFVTKEGEKVKFIKIRPLEFIQQLRRISVEGSAPIAVTQGEEFRKMIERLIETIKESAISKLRSREEVDEELIKEIEKLKFKPSDFDKIAEKYGVEVRFFPKGYSRKLPIETSFTAGEPPELPNKDKAIALFRSSSGKERVEKPSERGGTISFRSSSSPSPSEIVDQVSQLTEEAKAARATAQAAPSEPKKIAFAARREQPSGAEKAAEVAAPAETPKAAEVTAPAESRKVVFGKKAEPAPSEPEVPAVEPTPPEAVSEEVQLYELPEVPERPPQAAAEEAAPIPEAEPELPISERVVAPEVEEAPEAPTVVAPRVETAPQQRLRFTTSNILTEEELSRGTLKRIEPPLSEEELYNRSVQTLRDTVAAAYGLRFDPETLVNSARRLEVSDVGFADNVSVARSIANDLRAVNRMDILADFVLLDMYDRNAIDMVALQVIAQAEIRRFDPAKYYDIVASMAKIVYDLPSTSTSEDMIVHAIGRILQIGKSSDRFQRIINQIKVIDNLESSLLSQFATALGERAGVRVVINLGNQVVETSQIWARIANHIYAGWIEDNIANLQLNVAENFLAFGFNSRNEAMSALNRIMSRFAKALTPILPSEVTVENILDFARDPLKYEKVMRMVVENIYELTNHAVSPDQIDRVLKAAFKTIPKQDRLSALQDAITRNIFLLNSASATIQETSPALSLSLPYDKAVMLSAYRMLPEDSPAQLAVRKYADFLKQKDNMLTDDDAIYTAMVEFDRISRGIEAREAENMMRKVMSDITRARNRDFQENFLDEFFGSPMSFEDLNDAVDRIIESVTPEFEARRDDVLDAMQLYHQARNRQRAVQARVADLRQQLLRMAEDRDEAGEYIFNAESRRRIASAVEALERLERSMAASLSVLSQISLRVFPGARAGADALKAIYASPRLIKFLFGDQYDQVSTSMAWKDWFRRMASVVEFYNERMNRLASNFISLLQGGFMITPKKHVVGDSRFLTFMREMMFKTDAYVDMLKDFVAKSGGKFKDRDIANLLSFIEEVRSVNASPIDALMRLLTDPDQLSTLDFVEQVVRNSEFDQSIDDLFIPVYMTSHGKVAVAKIDEQTWAQIIADYQPTVKELLHAFGIEFEAAFPSGKPSSYFNLKIYRRDGTIDSIRTGDYLLIQSPKATSNEFVFINRMMQAFLPVNGTHELESFIRDLDKMPVGIYLDRLVGSLRRREKYYEDFKMPSYVPNTVSELLAIDIDNSIIENPTVRAELSRLHRAVSTLMTLPLSEWNRKGLFELARKIADPLANIYAIPTLTSDGRLFYDRLINILNKYGGGKFNVLDESGNVIQGSLRKIEDLINPSLGFNRVRDNLDRAFQALNRHNAVLSSRPLADIFEFAGSDLSPYSLIRMNILEAMKRGYGMTDAEAEKAWKIVDAIMRHLLELNGISPSDEDIAQQWVRIFDRFMYQRSDGSGIRDLGGIVKMRFRDNDMVLRYQMFEFMRSILNALGDQPISGDVLDSAIKYWVEHGSIKFRGMENVSVHSPNFWSGLSAEEARNLRKKIYDAYFDGGDAFYEITAERVAIVEDNVKRYETEYTRTPRVFLPKHRDELMSRVTRKLLDFDIELPNEGQFYKIKVYKIVSENGVIRRSDAPIFIAKFTPEIRIDEESKRLMTIAKVEFDESQLKRLSLSDMQSLQQELRAHLSFNHYTHIQFGQSDPEYIEYASMLKAEFDSVYGMTEFVADVDQTVKHIITALQGANFSTFLHEFYHAIEEFIPTPLYVVMMDDVIQNMAALADSIISRLGEKAKAARPYVILKQYGITRFSELVSLMGEKPDEMAIVYSALKEVTVRRFEAALLDNFDHVSGSPISNRVIQRMKNMLLNSYAKYRSSLEVSLILTDNSKHTIRVMDALVNGKVTEDLLKFVKDQPSAATERMKERLEEFKLKHLVNSRRLSQEIEQNSESLENGLRKLFDDISYAYVHPSVSPEELEDKFVYWYGDSIPGVISVSGAIGAFPRPMELGMSLFGVEPRRAGWLYGRYLLALPKDLTPLKLTLTWENDPYSVITQGIFSDAFIDALAEHLGRRKFRALYEQIGDKVENMLLALRDIVDRLVSDFTEIRGIENVYIGKKSSAYDIVSRLKMMLAASRTPADVERYKDLLQRFFREETPGYNEFYIRLFDYVQTKFAVETEAIRSLVGSGWSDYDTLNLLLAILRKMDHERTSSYTEVISTTLSTFFMREHLLDNYGAIILDYEIDKSFGSRIVISRPENFIPANTDVNSIATRRLSRDITMFERWLSDPSFYYLARDSHVFNGGMLDTLRYAIENHHYKAVTVLHLGDYNLSAEELLALEQADMIIHESINALLEEFQDLPIVAIQGKPGVYVLASTDEDSLDAFLEELYLSLVHEEDIQSKELKFYFDGYVYSFPITFHHINLDKVNERLQAISFVYPTMHGRREFVSYEPDIEIKGMGKYLGDENDNAVFILDKELTGFGTHVLRPAKSAKFGGYMPAYLIRMPEGVDFLATPLENGLSFQDALDYFGIKLPEKPSLFISRLAASESKYFMLAEYEEQMISLVSKVLVSIGLALEETLKLKRGSIISRIPELKTLHDHLYFMFRYGDTSRFKSFVDRAAAVMLFASEGFAGIIDTKVNVVHLFGDSLLEFPPYENLRQIRKPFALFQDRNSGDELLDALRSIDDHKRIASDLEAFLHYQNVETIAANLVGSDTTARVGNPRFYLFQNVSPNPSSPNIAALWQAFVSAPNIPVIDGNSVRYTSIIDILRFAFPPDDIYNDPELFKRVMLYLANKYNNGSPEQWLSTVWMYLHDLADEFTKAASLGNQIVPQPFKMQVNLITQPDIWNFFAHNLFLASTYHQSKSVLSSLKELMVSEVKRGAPILDMMRLREDSVVGATADVLLRSLGEDATSISADLHNVINYGGTFGSHNVDRGAISEMNRIMIDYAHTSPFDEWMKMVIPFWMFPSRSIPYWMSVIASHPELLTFYAKYLRWTDRSHWQDGAVTTTGQVLPSLRGYMPLLPGVYFNPLAPFLFRYVVPDIRDVPETIPEDEMGAMQRVAKFFLDDLPQYGFSINPVFQQLLMAFYEPYYPRTNLLQEILRIVFMTDYIPPAVERTILTKIRQWTKLDMPDTWRPEVSWMDYLIEREILQDYYQRILATDNQVERDRIAAEARRIILNPDRDNDPIWNEYKWRLRTTNYYRSMAGHFTGVYTKTFSSAYAELIELRNHINALRASINNVATADMFDLLQTPSEVYNLYNDTRFNTPEGSIYSGYQLIRYVVDPETNLAARGKRRLELMQQEAEVDLTTKMFYQALDEARARRDELLRQIPLGDTKARSKIMEAYFEEVSNIVNSPQYDTRRKVRYFGAKPEELIKRDLERDWWLILSSTRPKYSDFEEYEEYQKAMEEWKNSIPTLAAQLYPKFWVSVVNKAIMERQEERIPELRRLVDELFKNTDANAYEQYQLSNDTAIDAIWLAYQRLYIDPFYDAVKDKKGIEYDLAMRRFMETRKPPTEKEIKDFIKKTYGDKFSDAEIEHELSFFYGNGKQPLDVKERNLVQKPLEQQAAEEVWDILNAAKPQSSEAWKALVRNYVLLGGYESDIDVFYATNGDPTKWGDIQKFYDFRNRLLQAAKEAGIKPLSQLPTGELEKRYKAQKSNETFRAEVVARLGDDFFNVLSYYYQLSDRERKAFRQNNPDLYAKIQLYYQMRDEYAALDPNWAEFYHPSYDPNRSSSSASWTQTSSGTYVNTKRSAALRYVNPTEDMEFIHMGKRSTMDALRLFIDGMLGRGGAEKRPKWSKELLELLHPVAVEEFRRGEISKETLTYVNKLSQLHPELSEEVRQVITETKKSTGGGGGGRRLEHR